MLAEKLPQLKSLKVSENSLKVNFTDLRSNSNTNIPPWMGEDGETGSTSNAIVSSSREEMVQCPMISKRKEMLDRTQKKGHEKQGFTSHVKSLKYETKE